MNSQERVFFLLENVDRPRGHCFEFQGFLLKFNRGGHICSDAPNFCSRKDDIIRRSLSKNPKRLRGNSGQLHRAFAGEGW